jgi:ribosomal protein S8
MTLEASKQRVKEKMAAGGLDLRMFASKPDKCSDIPELVEYITKGLADYEKKDILLFENGDEVVVVSTREGTLFTTHAIHLANAFFMLLGIAVDENLEYQMGQD